MSKTQTCARRKRSSNLKRSFWRQILRKWPHLRAWSSTSKSLRSASRACCSCPKRRSWPRWPATRPSRRHRWLDTAIATSSAPNLSTKMITSEDSSLEFKHSISPKFNDPSPGVLGFWGFGVYLFIYKPKFDVSSLLQNYSIKSLYR